MPASDGCFGSAWASVWFESFEDGFPGWGGLGGVGEFAGFGGFGVAAGVERAASGFALFGGVPAVIGAGLIFVGSGVGGRGEGVEPIGLARTD